MEEYYNWEPIGCGGKRVGNIEVWKTEDGKYLLDDGKNEWLVDMVRLYKDGRVIAKFGDETLEYFI